MADERVWNVYEGQDYLTPGARETLDAVDAVMPSQHSHVLDVAYGTGAGGLRLAAAHDCSVLGVDLHPFAAAVQKRAAHAGVADRVAFVTGDGGRLPVRDAAFDVAVCIGAPSIVGTERCLAEMSRALRPEGALVVSDWVWARKPVPPEAMPQGYDIDPLTLDEYTAIMRRVGLDVVRTARLSHETWAAYYEPLRINLAKMRAASPGETWPIDEELRIFDSGLAEEWWRYVVFLGRRI